jgi:large subunit ribosomal protein L15
MATRLRKTRKLRGSRTYGWGQVAQHRASGHKGGLGVSGQLKHHFSSMLKNDPDHFGHDSTHRPHPVVTRKWASVRDLDDIFSGIGATRDGKNTIDLGAAGYDKLLGGGSVTSAYTITVPRFTETAARKVRDAGGEVLKPDG